MTKLSDVEAKTLATWEMVTDALLDHIRHHREQVLATWLVDWEIHQAHTKAMRRGTDALATFLRGPDD